MKHILIVLVENQPGVLARIAGLFSRRGFNIGSLTVGETENPNLSRMTIVVEGDQAVLEQVTKQLHKLINVIKITDITESPSVVRELVLLKLKATAQTRGEIVEICNIFRAKVVDVGREALTIEVTGSDDKIDALVELLRPFGLKELVRTGKIAMVRSTKNKVKSCENDEEEM